MNTLNAQIREPRQSTGGTLLKVAIAAALVFAGYQWAYHTDPDWDKDGIPNEVEDKYRLNPHDADSDKDGVKDNKDPYPRNPGISSSGSDTFTVCLTSDKKGGQNG